MGDFSIPVVQQALVDLLREHFPDSRATHVGFGLPTKVPQPRERFYVLDDENFRRARTSAFATDTYDLRVQVEVKMLEGTAKQCSDRRWALIAELDDLVRASGFRRYLDDQGGIVAAQSTHTPWEKGFIAVSIVRIAVKAKARG